MTPHDAVNGFRLSPQQEHLWALAQEGRRGVSQCALRLEGALDAAALESALRRLVERHEILRTTFHCLPGMSTPVQVVADSARLRFRSVDLGARGDGGRDGAAERLRREEVVERLRSEEALAPYDPDADPPLRAALGTLADEDHALVLTLPSLCADAASLRNAADELARLYAAASRGEEVKGEALQYADYAEFQRELREGAEAEAGRSYWLERGVYLTPALALPLQSAATTTPGASGVGAVRLELEPAAGARVRGLAEAWGVPVAFVTLACWQTLLHRLSGREHVVVGRICDGRIDEALASALGRFSRQVPALCHFEHGLTFESVLARVAESAREDELWQDYFDPEDLSRAAAGARIERAAPFVFESVPPSPPRSSAGVTFSVLHLSSDAEPFDLKLHCVEEAGAPALTLFFDRRRCPQSLAVRLARQLEMLVGQVTAEPRLGVGAVELLDETERHQLLVEWNDTRADFAAAAGVDRLIDARAAERPDATAVVFEDEQLTYGALGRLAGGLARRLRARGVGPETRVALCLERSMAFVVGMLGVLKAGGVCVPLDPSYPKERLAFIYDDARAALALTQTSLRGLLPERAESVCLDVHPSTMSGRDIAGAGGASEQRGAATTGENLAYVVYTSGSTGVPKGVAVRHESLCNYVGAMAGRLGLTAEDIYLHTASVSFSASARQLFVPLARGARVVLATAAERKDPLALSALFRQRDITVWDTVPSFLASFAEAFRRQDGARRETPNGVPRSILVTGEVLSPDTVAKWLTRPATGARVVNLYGQSETTGTVILQPFAEPHAPGRASVPVGRPLANTRAFLLDARLRPVPTGVAGEMYLSGASLARGYLDAALTAERFVPDPFGTEPGGRLYKTGDLAAYLTDGRLDFVSRGDDQVQIRGMRVQLKEVEAVLGRHEAVQRAVVVAREDETGDRRLAAYVVPRQEGANGVGGLREYLKERLPDYMIPAAFVLLDALPLTPTGKVDRLALPAPDHARRDSEAPFVAPRTPLESVVAEVWAEVLKVERVGVSDNFFDLGGHSMLVTQVLVRLRDMLQEELSLQRFFEAPTVAKVSETILRHAEQPERVEKTAELLLAISRLSDAEAQTMLAGQQSNGND